MVQHLGLSPKDLGFDSPSVHHKRSSLHETIFCLLSVPEFQIVDLVFQLLMTCGSSEITTSVPAT